MAHICLVAGDPSGDQHAACLVETLRRLEPTLRFAGLGGSRMREAGVELLDEFTQTASIGPFDAAKHLRRFVQARKRLWGYLCARRPKAVILVDFGDFNLPIIAPLAKRLGLRVIYFVSPQIWAWGRFRLRWVKRYVDRMLVLFRFEETFYRRAGVPVTWVGHPLIETARPTVLQEQARIEFGINPWRMVVGLLPGSRAQEVARHLPVLLSAASQIAWHMPGVQFVLPKAPEVPSRLFDPLKVDPGLDVLTCENRLYDCLQLMDAAVISSGTATIQAALFAVPMVVIYRTSLPTYLAARTVVRVPHIAMVNLIAGKRVVPELIQHRATPRRVAKELVALLRSQERRATMQQALRKVKQELGPPGAIERAASAVLNELKTVSRRSGSGLTH